MKVKRIDDESLSSATLAGMLIRMLKAKRGRHLRFKATASGVDIFRNKKRINSIWIDHIGISSWYKLHNLLCDLTIRYH